MNSVGLYKVRNETYRILDVEINDSVKDRWLVIKCINRSMPYWCDELDGGSFISEEELLKETNREIKKELNSVEMKEAFDKYGTISMIIPYIGDLGKRKSVIDLCADTYKLNKATIRKRLCEYLIYQTKNVFVSNRKEKKELSKDEKNIRWALNKYYYNPLKLSLMESYKRMLKDRYCDQDGKLLSSHPTYRQFQYFYSKKMRIDNEVISRNGYGEYSRNYRSLLGSGIREYCTSLGYGMLDSTMCDIYLINKDGELEGRPILTACIDGYSSMCLGYSIGFNGGVDSLKKLIKNVCTNKVEHCERFNVEIEESMWNCELLPHKLITDKGREYASESFAQLSDYGVEIINLPPYRPDLKGAVEKFFDLVQKCFKSILANRGVIYKDYQERGAKDYRLNASLTLEEFEQIIVMCIISYNTNTVVNLPYELVNKVDPYPFTIWNYCLDRDKDNLIEIDKEKIDFTLLPRVEGEFKRNGLFVNSLRYKNTYYKERYLKGGKCIVAYDPKNIGKVWLVENGEYIEFEIIEKFFEGKNIDEAIELIEDKKNIEKECSEKVLQGSIDLTKKIEEVLDSIDRGKHE